MLDATKLFRRKEDVHCVVFHVSCLAAYALAFWLWLHPEVTGIDTFAEQAAFVVAAAFLLGWISGVDVGVNFHNHTHRKLFRSDLLNRWATRVWTVSGGWPGWFWQYSHVTVHHANLLRERDWTLPRRRPDGSFESIYRYVLLHWPWRYVYHLASDWRHRRMNRRRAVVEFAWFAALWTIPFLIDFWMAVWLWALPHWVGNCITMGSGMYVQHAGCVPKDQDHPMQHSNGFLSPFFNQTMFNIGYHVEHHDHPGVHWADLPAFHRSMEEQLREGGAHYVPYGYYGAARLLAGVGRREDKLQRFRDDGVVLFVNRRAAVERAESA